MDKDIQDYRIRSPRREKPISTATERAYKQAKYNFIFSGGRLPASETMVLNYIADLSSAYSFNTISQRIAALSRWHHDQGFNDPTKASVVRQALVEARRICKIAAKNHLPLDFDLFDIIMNTHESRLQLSIRKSQNEQLLRMRRDKAIFSLGFWGGLRSGNLNSLMIEHISITSTGISIYRGSGQQKSILSIPPMEKHCPVQAMEQWLNASGLTTGIAFPAINRWGVIDNTKRAQINETLRRLAKQAEVNVDFTSNSLRVGFAEWAYSQGWNFMDIMNHIGWTPALAKLKYAR